MTSRRLRSRVVAASMALAAMSGVASCSEADPVTAADRSTNSTIGAPGTSAPEISAEQASRLADVLVTNHTLGGASFVATVPFGIAGFTLEGDVDWAGALGRATVTPTGDASERRPFDIVFNTDTIIEELPGLESELPALGGPAAGWVRRPSGTSPLDVVVALVGGAASAQRDNPVLLQSRGVRYLGEAPCPETGTRCDRFRDGRAVYLVDVGSERLVGIEATLDVTGSTVTVVFSGHGGRSIELPSGDDIVDLADVGQDRYTRLRNA